MEIETNFKRIDFTEICPTKNVLLLEYCHVRTIEEVTSEFLKDVYIIG